MLVAEAGAVAECEAWGVMDFGQHYRNILRPFQWTFTRDELARVLDKTTDREHAPIAATARTPQHLRTRPPAFRSS